MLCTHTTCCSLYLLFFSSSPLSDLSSLLTDNLLCIHYILPPLLPFFLSVCCELSWEKVRACCLFFPNALQLSRRSPVTLRACVSRAVLSRNEARRSEASTQGNLHCSDTDNDKCTPRPDGCPVSCIWRAEYWIFFSPHRKELHTLALRIRSKNLK